MTNTKVIPPGSVLGMLGDGQLGQMTALAAANLGYKVAVLGPGGRDSPTGHVAYWAEAWGKDTLVSDELLDRFCSVVGPDSAVMLEWENVPVSLVERIEAKGIGVRPNGKVLAVAQDRLLEKECAKSLGIQTVRYWNIEPSDGVTTHIRISGEHDRSWVGDCILKTRRDGYDGKGQVRISEYSQLGSARTKLKNVPCVLEEVVDFVCEISMIVARKPGQTMEVYGPFENVHENGILRQTTKTLRGPAISQFSAEDAAVIAVTAAGAAYRLAEHLDVHGLLAVEFFVLKDGTVIFNEMAPRPHNSGHLTIECCRTSQFEQYVRAACNLPFGSSEFLYGGAMLNILGDEANNWPSLAGKEKTALHLYGKGEAKPGRKMGHLVNIFR